MFVGLIILEQYPTTFVIVTIVKWEQIHALWKSGTKRDDVLDKIS